MEEALTSMRNAIEVYQQTGESYWLPRAQSRVTMMQAELDELKRQRLRMEGLSRCPRFADM